ncbi:MAG: hypothetical protein P1V97_29370, partial [Planctomycetota bacterium]|nr:hypothetical protein [Planctomycetota bacterium]
MDLKAYLVGENLESYTYGFLERSQRWIARNPSILSSSVLLLLLLVGGFYFQQSLQAAVEKEAHSRAEELTAKGLKARFEKSMELFNKAEASIGALKEEGLSRKIEEGLKLGGRTESQLLRAAEIYRKAKLFDQSLQILNEIEKNYSPAYEALYKMHLVESRETNNQFTLTIPFKRLIRRANRRREENEYTLMGEAFKSFRSGDWQETIAFCDRMEKFTTKRFELYVVRASAKSQIGDKLGALKDLDRAIVLDSTHAISFNNRGSMYFRLGEEQAAERDWFFALALDPNVVVPYIEIGQKRLRKKQLKPALYFFNKGLGRFPKNFKLLLLKADVLHELKQYESAIFHYSKALAISPSSYGVYVSRGTCKISLQRYKDGLDDFLSALKLKSSDFNIHLKIGQAHFLLDQFATALDYVDSAFELNPDSVEIVLQRAFTKNALGQNAGALRDFDHALNLDPKQAKIYLYKGNLRKRLHSFQIAAVNYEEYLRL